MPGPLLGVTINGSLKRGWKAGPLLVLGHGILEFTLIIIMVFGLKDFFTNPKVAGLIGLLGGAFLANMGYGMLKSGIKKTVYLENQDNKAGIGKGLKNLVLVGILVSATNPYFIMWWATTGVESVRWAYTLGYLGVLFFFLGHILSDLTWYSTVSIT